MKTKARFTREDVVRILLFAQSREIPDVAATVDTARLVLALWEAKQHAQGN